jgi:hypothetical protein
VELHSVVLDINAGQEHLRLISVFSDQEGQWDEFLQVTYDFYLIRYRLYYRYSVFYMSWKNLWLI